MGPMAELPATLEDLLEPTDVGVRYPVTVRSNEALMGATLFGVVMALVMFGLSVITIIAFPLCLMFAFVGVVIGLVAPFLGTFVKKKVMLEITGEGFRQHTLGGQSVTWPRVKQIRLRGSEGKRMVRLSADSFVLREWKAVPAHSDTGWDVEKIRAFATYIAELAGQELVDELPGLEAFEGREEERYQKAFDRRQKKRDRREASMEAQFPELHAVSATDAVLRDLDDGQAYILDRGQRHVLSKETSTTEEQPVTLREGAVVVGKRTEQLSDFEAVYVAFEKREDGIDVLLYADLKNGKGWRLARRESVGTPKMKGVAADLIQRMAAAAG